MDSLSVSSPFVLEAARYILLRTHEHVQRESTSGLAGAVSDHTSLILPPDVIFMFGSCTGGKEGYFPKCLLLICWREEPALERMWRELPKQTRRNLMSVPPPRLLGSTRSSLKFL